MRLSKLCVMVLLIALLVGSISANAFYFSSYYNYKVHYTDQWAYDYEYSNYDEWEVNSQHYENGRYLIYMYDKPSSSGQPISWYANGTRVRVIEEYPMGDKTYVYAIGPDGYLGFLRKAWLEQINPWDPDPWKDHYPYYEVASEFYESGHYRVYMYSVPNSSGTPIGTYINGQRVQVTDPKSNSSYAYCIGPDGKKGYILRRRLSRIW